MNLNLGIILENEKIKNHRSLLKVLLNPWLRKLFKIQIATLIDVNTQKIINLKICKCKKCNLEFSFNYPLNDDNNTIIKKRILF